MSIVGVSGQSPRFSPVDIPGLSVWLDAADRNSLVLSGSNVTSWRDKSGLNNHATGVNNPVYSSGSNGISFTASSLQYFTLPDGALPYSNSSYTVFLLFQIPNAGSEFGFLGGGNNNVNQTLNLRNTYTSNFYCYWYGNDIQASGTITMNAINIGTTWYTSRGTRNISLNFGSVTTDTPGTRSQPATSNVIGRTTVGQYLTGFLYEILVYDSALTTPQRQAVEGYLARKWGMTSLLPAGHPGRTTVTSMRGLVPTDIDGCALWLDAQDSNAYTLSGSNVTAVLDKSSNAWSLGSASTFTMNSTRFNGTYPSFLGTGGQLGSNGSFALSQPVTIYFVGQANTYNASTFLFDGAGGGRVVIYAGAQLFAGGEFVATNRASAVSSPHVMTAVVNGPSSSIVLNGVTTTGDPGSNSWGGIRISSRNTGGDGYVGHICELLIYSGAHGSALINAMTGYLRAKWGLQSIALGGTTHPFRYGPPMGIPSAVSGCTLWLDGADSASMTLSGSNVTQWNDKSGSGRHAVAQTAATYDTSALALRFSGSNYYSFNDFNFAVGSNFSFFFAERVQSSANDRPFVATDRTGVQNGCPHIVLATPNGPQQIKFAYWGNDLYLNDIFTYTTAAAQPLFVWSFLQTSTGRSMYLNGTLLLSDSNTTLPTAWTTPLLGRSFSTNYYNGFMHEVLAFGGSLGATQRQQIEGYLAWKWGRQTALPGPTSNWARFYRPLFPEFTPLQVPGATIWLDAADRGTLTLSGTTVTRWTDKTANRYTATGVNGVSYNTTSNGIAFANASSQYMDLSDGCFPTGNSSYTYMLLFTPARTSNMQMISGGNNNTLEKFIMMARDTGKVLAAAFGEASVPFSSNTYTVGARNLAVATYQSGGTRTVWLNFVQGESDTPSTINQAAGMNNLGTLGPNRAFESYDGQFHEILAFSNALSTGDRQRMEGYLAWKWGMTSSLPSNHPFKSTKP